MMMPDKIKKNNPRFIIVDDDPLNNMLCKKVIARTIPDAEVVTFTEPETGLSYLEKTYSKEDAGNAILFLDINMPAMTGWEFMEHYKLADKALKNHLAVYMLSSSINPLDREKARVNPDVVDYIEKPLSAAVMKLLV
jgi:CheY-like chemotaxis protein